MLFKMSPKNGNVPDFNKDSVNDMKEKEEIGANNLNMVIFVINLGHSDWKEVHVI